MATARWGSRQPFHVDPGGPDTSVCSCRGCCLRTESNVATNFDPGYHTRTKNLDGFIGKRNYPKELDDQDAILLRAMNHAYVALFSAPQRSETAEDDFENYWKSDDPFKGREYFQKLLVARKFPH